MDIRQLEAFVYTAKYQSFSLAAQKLYLSQPTVSSHICNLEKELHTQLLQRTTKALSMTPAGRRLYSYAAEILDLRHKAVLELTSQQEAMLHIGVSSVPSLHLLPELLAAYHVQAPEVRFRTSCSDSLDVIRKVSEGGCDIGLAGTKTAAPGCGFLPVTSDELVLAAPNTPHFREYQQQKEPLRALLREPFLSSPDQYIEPFLPPDTPRLEVTASDDGSILSMVAGGLGVSVLSSFSLVGYEGQVRVLQLEKPIALRLGAAVKSVNTIGTSARMFLTFLREYYGKDDTQ